MNKEIASLISRLVQFEYYGWFTKKEAKSLANYIISLQGTIVDYEMQNREIEKIYNNFEYSEIEKLEKIKNIIKR